MWSVNKSNSLRGFHGNIEKFHDFQGNLFRSHIKNLQMVRKAVVAMNTIYLVPISFAAENFSYLLMFSLQLVQIIGRTRFHIMPQGLKGNESFLFSYSNFQKSFQSKKAVEVIATHTFCLQGYFIPNVSSFVIPITPLVSRFLSVFVIRLLVNK